MTPEDLSEIFVLSFHRSRCTQQISAEAEFADKKPWPYFIFHRWDSFSLMLVAIIFIISEFAGWIFADDLVFVLFCV